MLVLNSPYLQHCLTVHFILERVYLLQNLWNLVHLNNQLTLLADLEHIEDLDSPLP